MADDESIAALLAELSVPQKAALCLGSDFWHTAPVSELGVEAVMVSDGPHGLRKQAERSADAGLRASEPATCFPTASALGCSWDPDLAREVGAALGAEARAQNIAAVLGPGINIKRHPLCGRNFEYLSEDPHLSGRLAAAMVDGLQSQQVGGCVKHFAANNQETDRMRVSADVDERTLREIYLPAFEHAVTAARPWLVMCSYNKVNGEYASQHRWLLTEVLREEWGFDGLVVSDWGAVHDRVAALRAGLDLEMPPNLGVSDRAIVDAIAAGTLDEAVLDRAAGRVLRLVHRSRRRQPADMDAAAHHALARQAAAQSLVLLKNDGVLPLTGTAGRTITVIGEFARTPRFQGAGSSQVSPTQVDMPLDALAAALPGATLRFAAGYLIEDTPLGLATHSGPCSGPRPATDPGQNTDPGPATNPGPGQDLVAEAVSAATGADVVLVFLGLPPAEESEGYDRAHIDLPDAQTSLLTRLAETAPGTPIVAVLCNGGAVRTTTWDHTASAVLECWLAGQATGSAVADVLTGAVNPAGRLAETIPLRLADCPAYLNFPGEEGHVRYGEGVFAGYRGYDAIGLPVAYPFGHGLSYSRFSYRDLRISQAGSADAGDLAVMVRCTITNTSGPAGAEVVQVYVADPAAAVARPPRELKAFAKIALEPGAEREVTFTLTARDLSYWSALHRRWVLEGGEFHICVGASSRDIRLSAAISVAATPPALPLSGTSTLTEWLTDPVGRQVLRDALGTRPDGRPGGILGSGELLAIIGNMPLATLAAFPGLGVTQELIDSLVAAVTERRAEAARGAPQR
ncbi:MAG TPA: glycoside hydrolase family 3 C-terminal domain-containing protein [Streptosporangiaceae bacterium]